MSLRDPLFKGEGESSPGDVLRLTNLGPWPKIFSDIFLVGGEIIAWIE